MKRILLIVSAFIAFTPVMKAGDKDKSSEPDGIHWLSMDDLQVKMREEPRKVYVDIYTDWCGWCKVMEKKTFTNPGVIKYLNEKFYCVHFNAEKQQSIHFMGKDFAFDPEHKANALAVEWMKGEMSYPTNVIMEERFQNPQHIGGYQDVSTFEMILKFFGDNYYKNTPWPDFQKAYKPLWAGGEEVQVPMASPDTPPGH